MSLQPKLESQETEVLKDFPFKFNTNSKKIKLEQLK